MDEQFDLPDLKLDDTQLSVQARELTVRARNILSKLQSNRDSLPDVLLELLSTIIKPLFSSGHPQITAAGRKPAFPAAPTLPHAVPISLHEEKAWKITLTVPLLQVILKSYPTLPQPRRREVLEAHFPLLIPPILNITDDISAGSKADGYSLLGLLCDAILIADSDILQRTGLTDVFVDVIKPNFMLLPTLTPEDEALLVLQQLYPAFHTLIRARFDVTLTKGSDVKPRDGSNSEDGPGQTYLKLLLRHGLLAGLSHLGAGTSTSFISLTTFLVTQLCPTIEAMGLTAVVHLQTIMPMLQNLLMDPFGLAAPELLLATIDALDTLIQVCSPRIKDRWWPECLRSLVGCWCNILDDENDASEKPPLAKVKGRLVEVMKLLSNIVGDDDWRDAKTRLCEEAEDLRELFA